jgi:hypothetical protein
MRSVFILTCQATVPSDISVQDYGKFSGQTIFHWILILIWDDNYLHINAKLQRWRPLLLLIQRLVCDQLSHSSLVF